MNHKPKLSKMMVKLYGEQEAQAVYNRLQEVDPWFNEYVQYTIYDQLWALPPLTLIQKSLVTIVSLATLKKEEQLQIHLKGFFNLGGTEADIIEIFNYMLEAKHINSLDKLLSILSEVSQHAKKERTKENNSFITTTNLAFINLATLTAKGENTKTKVLMENLLQNKILSEEQIAGTLRQIMTYCGCPCTMNGFAMLQEIKQA